MITLYKNGEFVETFANEDEFHEENGRRVRLGLKLLDFDQIEEW